MALSQEQLSLLKSYGFNQFEDSEATQSSDTAQFLIDALTTLKNDEKDLIRTTGSFQLINQNSGMLFTYIEINTESKKSSLVLSGKFLVSINIDQSKITAVHVNELTEFNFTHKDNSTEMEDELDMFIEEDFEHVDNGRIIIDAFFTNQDWLKSMNDLVFYRPN